MNSFMLAEGDFRIYQPFFKKHVWGFAQKMLFSPVQMRCYHFFMPDNYLSKHEFNCIPDGCVDVAFIYNDEDYWVELIGSPVKRKALRCFPGCSYFGVRLAPGYCLSLDDYDLAEITDNEIIFKSSELNLDFFMERLRLLSSLQDKADLFLAVFAGDITSAYANSVVASAMQIINMRKGAISVLDIGRQTGYSERQLARLLGASLNLSPKTLCRITRLQNAIHNILNNPCQSNIGFIANLAYADQAHFQREFKEFTGLTPQEFAAQKQRESRS
jgi:AraC-like DNA-binding protein